jgi:hypothetical protein
MTCAQLWPRARNRNGMATGATPGRMHRTGIPTNGSCDIMSSVSVLADDLGTGNELQYDLSR